MLRSGWIVPRERCLLAVSRGRTAIIFLRPRSGFAYLDEVARVVRDEGHALADHGDVEGLADDVDVTGAKFLERRFEVGNGDAEVM